MTDPRESPWAQSGPGEPRADFQLPATPPTPSEPIWGSQPLTPDPDPGWRAGAVTGTGLLIPPETPVPAPEPAPIDEATRARRTVMWFAGGAAAVLVVGLVVLLSLVLTGRSPFPQHSSAPPDTRPPLARAWPPPSVVAQPGTVPATPKGDRTVDSRSGISYKAYGAPWRTWTDNWTDAGELHVSYRTGQYFVTEVYGGGDYLASILSGSVPATNNDSLTLDLKCTGHQVAADVRTAYYPQPNTMEMIKDVPMVLGGRPAWVSEFRLHFHEPTLKATDELVAIALIDVGRPEAAVLYVSVPGTHKQYDYVVDDVLASVRPITR